MRGWAQHWTISRCQTQTYCPLFQNYPKMNGIYNFTKNLLFNHFIIIYLVGSENTNLLYFFKDKNHNSGKKIQKKILKGFEIFNFMLMLRLKTNLHQKLKKINK